MWSFEYTDKNFVNYVAATPQFKFIRLVEDDVVLTTIGNFLNYVPDQNRLEKIRPSLVAKYMQEEVVNKVTIID